MAAISLKEILKSLGDLDIDGLEILESAIIGQKRAKQSSRLSNDPPSMEDSEGEGLGLNGWAQKILEDEANHDLTLPDQALLASLILSEAYQQEAFSSRDINDVIAESGRPRVAHITSALTPLSGRKYLVGSTKELSLSPEGRTKARGLIGMLRRKAKNEAGAGAEDQAA